MFILLTSLLVFTADSTKPIEQPTYEKVSHWIDTVGTNKDEGGRALERRRYRYGPREPGDDLCPTYYDSPWTRPGGKV